MDSLFDRGCRDRFVARIESLRPDSTRAWGKMSVEQTMSHCSLALEAATGDAKLARPLPARMIGWMFKGWLLGAKPFVKNSPTHPQLTMPAAKTFEHEQARLIAALRKFCDAGPQSAARFEHAFVGKLTGEEWGLTQYKHLDHHLRQFGA